MEVLHKYKTRQLRLSFFLSYFYIFLVKRIYCSLPSEQYLECSCIAVYKCILHSYSINTLCVDMQISCSALNAPADSTDGEQQKMEEPTSTRVADKVPAICPLTSPFSIFFQNVRYLFGPQHCSY